MKVKPGEGVQFRKWYGARVGVVVGQSADGNWIDVKGASGRLCLIEASDVEVIRGLEAGALEVKE